MTSYLKSKINNRIIKYIYLISLIPIILYAVYKNGYIPYSKNLCSLSYFIKPILLSLLSYVFAILWEYIYYKLIKKDKDYLIKMKNSYTSLYSILFSLIVPINVNYFIYILINFILLVMLTCFKKIRINYIVLCRILLVGILVIIGKYSYNNIFESNVLTSYTTFDIFLGHAVTSIGASSTFLVLLVYLGLLIIPSYKKNILLEIVGTYVIVILISSIFGYNIKEEIKLMLSNEIFFASCFVASISSFSPITIKMEILYSTLIGIIGFALCKFNIHEGIYLSILISNVIYLIIDKIGNLKVSNK